MVDLSLLDRYPLNWSKVRSSTKNLSRWSPGCPHSVRTWRIIATTSKLTELISYSVDAWWFNSIYKILVNSDEKSSSDDHSHSSWSLSTCPIRRQRLATTFQWSTILFIDTRLINCCEPNTHFISIPIHLLERYDVGEEDSSGSLLFNVCSINLLKAVWSIIFLIFRRDPSTTAHYKIPHLML